MNNTPVPSDEKGLKYLALGDSYTIGESVQERERFPYLTVQLLRKENISFQDPIYVAATGWTTADLQKAIEQQPTGTFDIVSLLIGVNDQYQGLSQSGYELRFTALLEKAIALAGNCRERVFVLSIPDYSVTPFVPASNKGKVHQEIEQFNFINERVTLQHRVSYINITPLTRQAAQDASYLANDGLHYSAKQHQQWAELLVMAIKKTLPNKPEHNN